MDCFENSKRIVSGLTFFLLLVSMSSCSSGGQKEPDKSISGRIPEAGKIHEKIACSSAPEFTYALYLPSGIKSDATQTWPVIIAFDSHGSGLIPVQKYRELAEKYGYILAGSNNSKNGQTPEQTGIIVSALIKEFLSRYPADTDQINLTGFSGGSRVASLSALTHNEIRGVIGCGAGFPGLKQYPERRFDYFGIAGLSDFNLNEMVQLEASLQKNNFRHCFMTFNGPHAWPPSENMEMAILWLSFNAMKDGRIKKDDRLIGSALNKMTTMADDRIKEKNMLEAANILEYELNCLGGLANTSATGEKLNKVRQNPVYRKQLKHREDMLLKEKQEQQLMMNQLFVKDIKWWKDYINKYKTGEIHPGDVEEQIKNKRLLSFLSLLCYSNALTAINQNNTELSFRIVDIYELADPANPEPDYLRSILFMRQKDTVSSMNQLQKAVDKGFSDKLRVMQQDEFQNLRDYRPYFDLLQKMK